MTDALVAVGANQGDIEGAFQAAVESIGQLERVDLVAVSDRWTTAAIGGPEGQHEFLNAALRIRTSLSSQDVHAHLMSIEEGLGRRRMTRWGPRKIDLDLILFGDEVCDSDRLQLPHPRMTFRRFVLGPAEQVAADLVDPLSGLTIGDYLQRLDQVPNLIVFNPAGSSKDCLLQALSPQFDGNEFVQWCQSRRSLEQCDWLHQFAIRFSQDRSSQVTNLLQMSEHGKIDQAERWLKDESNSVRYLIVDPDSFRELATRGWRCKLRVDRAGGYDSTASDSSERMPLEMIQSRGRGLVQLSLAGSQSQQLAQASAEGPQTEGQYRSAYLDISGQSMEQAERELAAALAAMQ